MFSRKQGLRRQLLLSIEIRRGDCFDLGGSLSPLPRAVLLVIYARFFLHTPRTPVQYLRVFPQVPNERLESVLRRDSTAILVYRLVLRISSVGQRGQIIARLRA